MTSRWRKIGSFSRRRMYLLAASVRVRESPMRTHRDGSTGVADMFAPMGYVLHRSCAVSDDVTRAARPPFVTIMEGVNPPRSVSKRSGGEPSASCGSVVLASSWTLRPRCPGRAGSVFRTHRSLRFHRICKISEGWTVDT